jgi:adenylate cyclase
VGKDTATEYFADGMADELTTALARVPGLKVAARSSSFTFRDQSVGAQHVGRRCTSATCWKEVCGERAAGFASRLSS